MRSHAAKALLGFLLALATATLGCSSNELTALEVETVGNYNLRLVEGEELPYPIGESEGQLIDVLSGRIELRTDHTCQFNHTYRYRDPGNGTSTTRDDNSACTWSMNQTVVNLKFGSGDSAGYISGVAGIDILVFDFTFDPFAVRFIYERENATHTSP